MPISLFECRHAIGNTYSIKPGITKQQFGLFGEVAGIIIGRGRVNTGSICGRPGREASGQVPWQFGPAGDQVYPGASPQYPDIMREIFFQSPDQRLPPAGEFPGRAIDMPEMGTSSATAARSSP